MSRIGNRILMIPEGVTVENKDNMITVSGPKGTLSKPLLNGVKFENSDGQVKFTIEDESNNAMHGTMNALVNNMIIGVTKGYSKVLQIVGVGYRFNVLVVEVRRGVLDLSGEHAPHPAAEEGYVRHAKR